MISALPRSTRSRSPAIPAIVGLTVTWGATILLVSPAAWFLNDPANLTAAVVGQLLFWLLGAIVISIVLRWERAPLRSLWFQPFGWQSVGWAIALIGLNYLVLFPVGEWVREGTGLPGLGSGMEDVMRFPVWYRILAVLGAGIVEEVLYRGFTVTRLAGLIGSRWLAGLVALLSFLALHVPSWGWGFAVGGLVGGMVVMAFFVWKRDLLALIIFHTMTDAIGLVIAPMYSRWWDAS